MAQGNGKVDIKIEDLDNGTALKVVLEALTSQQELLEEVKTQNAEILEKLNNLNLGTEGYSFDDVDEENYD